MKFRIGKKQKRAILTEDGHEVVVFPKGKEEMAELVCSILNENGTKPFFCAINHFAPASFESLLSNYKGLRDPDEKRDENFSPLHDSIMNAIYSNLLEHNKEQFNQLWSHSMFPERLTKEILRLVEQQIQRGI